MASEKITHEQSTFSIVLIGSFNPRIHHPLWYIQHGMMAPEEIEEVSELVCSDEVTIFVHNEIHFQVERHRFALTTRDESRFMLVKDFVVGTFQVLGHIPITALGINRDSEFTVDGAATFHAIGHSLAPKDVWRDFIQSPGMQVVAITGKPISGRAKAINARVQPTRLEYPFRVLVAINQHYEPVSDSGVPGDSTEKAIEIIESDWVEFTKAAIENATRLLDSCSIAKDRTSD